MAKKDLLIELAVREISTQCHFAILSYERLLKEGQANTDLAFTMIHSFLSHCALVAKFLWSDDLSKNTEKKQLSTILNISRSSAIRNKKFRNQLEHYDEYLFQWVSNSKKPIDVIADFNIGPRTAISAPNMIVVRNYNPVTSTFTLLDQDLNLKNLYDEACHIKQQADKWLKA